MPNQKKLKEIHNQDIEAGIRQSEKEEYKRRLKEGIKSAHCPKCGDTVISQEDGLCCNCV